MTKRVSEMTREEAERQRAYQRSYYARRYRDDPEYRQAKIDGSTNYYDRNRKASFRYGHCVIGEYRPKTLSPAPRLAAAIERGKWRDKYPADPTLPILLWGGLP